MLWQIEFDRLNIEKVKKNQKPNPEDENKEDLEVDKQVVYMKHDNITYDVKICFGCGYINTSNAKMCKHCKSVDLYDDFIDCGE